MIQLILLNITWHWPVGCGCVVLFYKTHQYSHSLQTHNFLGHIGHSADQLHWVYNDTDLPLYCTHDWGSLEDYNGRLETERRKHNKLIWKFTSLKLCMPSELLATYVGHHHEWQRKYCRWVWSTSLPVQASVWSRRNPYTCNESFPDAAALPQAHYRGNLEARYIWEWEPTIRGENILNKTL